MSCDVQISVAPMMDWTDRHCRYFHRLLHPAARLYTEMVTTGALLHGDVARHLAFNDSEHPVALQLGGSDPADLAACARLGEEWGYDEINLNCGCPSDRVQRGRFGACLMTEPDLVGDCLRAMADAVSIPVTIKTRIGIDQRDDYAFLADFVGSVTQRSGIDTVIIHARKAWLSGLSPRENREIPPLLYDRPARLKQDFPGLKVIANGGIADQATVEAQLAVFDGGMIGREAYQNPWFLRELSTDASLPDAVEIVESMAAYAQAEAGRGVPVKSIARHMLGLFHGRPGARKWRRYLSENAPRAGGDHGILLRALEAMQPPGLAA